MPRILSAALFAVVLAAPAVADNPVRDGFVPLFDGKTLDGWVNVNTHPGTFFVKDNEIVTTGSPTGFLRTAKQYENFILELEWKHVVKDRMANSGLFVWGDPLPAVGTPYTRGIEVQVLANAEVKDSYTSDGDVFSIHGATCKPDRPHPKGAQRCLPSEKRTKPAGEWNHYKVVANDGVIKLHVNGKEVSGVSQCNPRKGYLALESEGAECHFRNIKIKELPSTNPKPEQVAKEDEGHKSIFTGLDLAGWKTEKGAWTAAGGYLRCTGKVDLVSEKEFGPGELVFDFRTTGKGGQKVTFSYGGLEHSAAVKDGKPGRWARSVFGVDSRRGPIVFPPAEGLEIMNVFVREKKEK
jgi:hypothetical protein